MTADLEAATERANWVLAVIEDPGRRNLARAFFELKGALEQEHAHYDALLQHNQEVAADLAQERAARVEAEQKLDSWMNRQFAWEGKPPAVFIRELKRRAEQAESRLATVERENEVLYIERRQDRARVERSVQFLSRIYALMCSEDVASDGKRFHFHPPEQLVREAWEGLSAAIRKIPDEINAIQNAAGQENG